MSGKQPEALRLAERLEGWMFPDDASMLDIEFAAHELRHLHALNAELLAACREARVWLLGHDSAERQIALLDAALAKAEAAQ